MAVKWGKVSQALFGTEFDYNQETLHRENESTVCAQGALWLGMKNGNAEDIKGSDVLTAQKAKTVCRFYGLEKSAVGGIPEVNDDASGNIPKTVFAWLWLTHDKPRLKLLKELVGCDSSTLADRSVVVKAGRLLKQLGGEVEDSIGRVLDEHGIEKGNGTSLFWLAGIELLAPSFGFQYYEEARKIGALDQILKDEDISKALHRRLTSHPATGGWKKYVQKAKKK